MKPEIIDLQEQRVPKEHPLATEPPYMVFDDIVHPNDQQKLLDGAMDPNLMWCYNKVTAGDLKLKDKPNCVDVPQFVHPLQDMKGGAFSSHNWMADIVIDSLKANAGMEIEFIDRVKLNYIHKQPKWQHGWYNMPHCDKHLENRDQDNWVSAIYYINESDGDTYFFDKWWGDDPQYMRPLLSCQPRKGRVIIFHSNRYHASSCPVDYGARIIMNCVFKVKEQTK